MKKITNGLTPISTKTFEMSCLLKCRDTDWAFLAGFYDGEGTMAAIRQQRKTRAYYQLRFVISNTDFDILCSLQRQFGGSIHASIAAKNPKHKQVYMWHMESRKSCLPVLKGILPYIRYKKEEVRLAIEYYQGISPQPQGLVPDSEWFRRAQIIQAIRSIPGRRTRGHATLQVDLSEMIMSHKRHCANCRVQFVRVQGATIYCSTTCQKIGRKKQQRKRTATKRGATWSV